MHYSVDDLRYQLLEGPLCLEPLRVLEKRSITWHDRRVTFYGLGASHAVVIESGSTCLTELLTCAPLKHTGHILAEFGVTEVQEWKMSAAGLDCLGLVCSFALSAGDALPSGFPGRDTLAVAYPPHTDGQSPVTRVGWRVTEFSLHVETVHTYPEEGRGARSQTFFRMTKPIPSEGLQRVRTSKRMRKIPDIFNLPL